MMNKKGQVFLLGAIIIVLALLTVTGTYNTVKEYPVLSDFKEHTENYLGEVPKLLNKATYENKPEGPIIQRFSDLFVKQVKTKDPNFGVFYTYKDDNGDFHLVNTLTNRVLYVKAHGQDIVLQGITNSGSETCLAGISCTTTQTQTRDFGGRFSNNINLRDITSIQVCFVSNRQCTDLDPDQITAIISSYKEKDREAIGREVNLDSGNSNNVVDTQVQEF